MGKKGLVNEQLPGEVGRASRGIGSAAAGSVSGLLPTQQVGIAHTCYVAWKKIVDARTLRVLVWPCLMCTTDPGLGIGKARL